MSDRQDMDELIRDANANIARAKETLAEVADFKKRARDVSPEEAKAILAEIGIVLMIAAPVVGIFNKIFGTIFSAASKLIALWLKKK